MYYNLTKPQKLIYDMEKFVGGSVATICSCVLIDGQKSEKEIVDSVNEIFRLNDALRMRIVEKDGEAMQYISDYHYSEIKILRFSNKVELDIYASEYAKAPMDFYGQLAEITAVILDDSYGILGKFHHIVSDAWTVTLVGSQFNTIINGELPKAYSYIDYITGEKEYLESTRYSKDAEYYIEQYEKCDEITYISDKQNSSYISNRKTVVINPENTAKLAMYAKRNNTSMYMLFMAALGVYINRIKMNVENFYIGTAILNRTNVREKNTMGMYINTAPMLISLKNDLTFKENLNNIANGIISIIRHQKFNNTDINKVLREKFKLSGSLYDVMLSYQNAKLFGIGENFNSEWYPCGMQTESLQMHIVDHDSEGILKIHYDYLTDKFTENEIERLHQHICNLLFDAIADDSKKLYKLNILSADENQKLLYEFNNTAIDYPRDKCVHHLFEEQVSKTPDKIAIVACDNTLTYADLNKQANCVASFLITQGIKKGDIVAIKLPRKSYLFSAIIGVLKLGAAYMPIDSNYPDDRVEYMFNESEARYCIEESNITELLKSHETSNLNVLIDPNDSFCALHTSGSTGNPKMSLLKHSNIINFISANQRFWQGVDTVVSATIVTFDAFVMDSVLSVAQGKQVVLANEDEIYNQALFEKLFEHSDSNMFFSTPTKIENYIASSNDKTYLSRIKNFVIGGEVFTDHLLNLIKDVSPDSNVYNIYGPTETTICVTVAEVIDIKDLHIGKPIANTQIYIVDKFMNIVPIGITGELCIAGDGVGAGYLNRPELTAEKFIDNPFGDGKLYKTGDLAYWREDGNIAYVGRNDFQVKIRGLRIELGEIENAICCIDGISQAVVVVRKNAESRQLICAFYTGAEIDAKEIRALIGKKLPKYMLPHIFTHLDEMPLTTSGKVNRKTLPDVDLYAIDTAIEYVAPTTEKENILISAIEATLSIDKVGIMDNFFDIGGDSLKAIELISKLEKQGYHTDTKTIFECENAKELAEKIFLLKNHQKTFEFAGNIPATAAQIRVYTSQSMNSEITTYNVPYVFKVDSVDIDRLQNAVNKLIARHESLRTHFENKHGNIVQIINDNAECKIELLDCEDVNAFVRPFDLGVAPLLRVGVYENTIMVDMHHIITDGSSMPVFLNELNALYMGRSLDTTPIQYKQFAIEYSDHAESEKYWLSVYNDEIPVLEINTDFHRGQKQSFNGNAIYDSVDIDLHNKITAYCKKQGITPYVFYMSGFNILLSKFSGNEDIVVGMPISGRGAKYLDTIGMFVNTIALRNKPIGTKSVAEFLQEVKENSVNAINNQDYPYGELVKKLNIHTPDHNPLFDVMFAYQSEQMTDVVFGDKKAELMPVPITTSKYDFTFNVMPREDDVVILAEYCTDLYKEGTMKRFIDGYKLILEQMLDGKTALMDISPITEQEKNKLIYEFNDTAVYYPKDKCVHQLFEEQVAKTADKIAVIACDKTLTYAELNEQSNRIAHSLIDKGIGVGDIVAFALPRKSSLIATMFGILKAGAAYLPIDLDYPQERIDYMLEDSKAKICISSENINEFLLCENETDPTITLNQSNACYCIYTSGSTGKPKGTLLTHGNVVNYVDNNGHNVFGKIIKNDYKRIVSVTTVGFDIFVTESLLPLSNGLEIVLANEEQAKFQTKLNSLLNTYHVDVLQTTPTKMKSLIVDKDNLNYLKTLKAIVLGGEAVDKALVSELFKYTDAKFFNIYGPTETTVWSTITEISKDDIDITIGKPIANTQIYIVDQYMHSTPIGVIGELCIAGDGVGAGYLNRPELTAEKFIDNPFGKGKLYKTGDLAYWREDGNIAYVGRNDFQVKIRGLRIELGEIENAICSIEEISQAVVVVRKNNDGRQLICAFYTGAVIDAKEIRNHIGKKLPKYMLPHIFAHLDAMPLTSSGKVNRKALPEVDLENITNDTEYVAPETPMQKALCKLLELILGSTSVGIMDNFFDLGGDSLKAIEFVSKAHDKGIYFNLQNVFDHPTVKELCECIETGDKQAVSFADVDFTAVDKILSKNKVEYINVPQKSDVGNLLLAGATGYLGVHILADYLDNDTGTAYCLVRGKDKEDSRKRLQDTLCFYYGTRYSDMHRIEVISADLQKDHFGLSLNEYEELLGKINTVINCAASVKHYGSYKYFYEVNVETTKRLIDFCKAADAKLIHTSTLSVSGNSFGDQFDGYISDTEKYFYESSLYIGQPFDNVYARSKFEAEKAVLDAMADGLKANIMRMGNLTNRLSDGVFQKNHESNAFLQRVKGVLELGIFPDYLMNLYAEFTPIDEAANAVMTITRHFSTEQTVFHINSIKIVYFDDLFKILGKLGFNVSITDGKAFTKVLRGTAKQANMEHIFETFINDMDENDNLNYDSNIHIENEFTIEYLRKLGFEWSDIDIEYLKKYTTYFKNLGVLAPNNMYHPAFEQKKF